VDSETQKTDSERAVVHLVRKTLNEHISTMKLSSTQGELSASDISTLKSKVMDVLRQKSAALQVKVNDMEIRTYLFFIIISCKKNLFFHESRFLCYTIM